MTTDVLTRDPSRTAGQEAERASGARSLPTAGQVMLRSPSTVDAQASLFAAWGLLHGDSHRRLVVIDADVRPIGVLDERDIALEWPPGPFGAHHVPVCRLLRLRTGTRVRADDDVAHVAATMLHAREDAVAVVDEDGRLLGLVTVWQCLELLAGARGCDRQGRLTVATATRGGGVAG
jgi:IMP dehydrogenase